MDNLYLRELLNEILVPLSLCIIIVISHTLWDTRRKHGPKKWRDVAGIGSALALFWLFVTEMMRAVNAWIIIHKQNHGESLQYVVSAVPAMVYLLAGAISAAATFRLIYTLGPPEWGHRSWITAFLVTAAFVLFSELGGITWLTGGAW